MLPCVFLIPKVSKLFGFQAFLLLAYLMKVIPETLYWELHFISQAVIAKTE
jgi:hypothetical protein